MKKTNKKNKIGQPLILVSYAIVLLFILSLFKLPIGILNSLEKIDILADIRKDEPKPVPTKVVTKDTIAVSKNESPTMDSTLIIDFDSTCPLKHFYQKLDGAKLAGKKVRIAYFGDSFVEGDEVTDELRLQLQKLFGGNGIGFLPMQSNVASLYTQVRINSSGWIDYNFRDNPYKFPLGLSGHVFHPFRNGEADYFPKTNNLPTEVKLYTGRMFNYTVVFTMTNGKSVVAALNTDKLINETASGNGEPIKSFKITTTNEDIPFYGVSLEGTKGVYLDNYSFRGNNSILTQQISSDVMAQFNSFLHYDLIIVHYGLNALEHDKQKSPWFENSMNTVIKNIRKGFGNVPILLVSTSDLGYKYNGKYTTEKAVPYMVATQKEIARSHRVAFWNLFEAMGGENTMVDWVEGDTILAAKDYTHLNTNGAKRLGDLFFNKLIASKNYYQQLSITKK